MKYGTQPSKLDAVLSHRPRPLLFTPIKINGVPLENRVCIPAMVTWLSPDGTVNEAIRRRYLGYARGEPGMVVLEATGIHEAKSGPPLWISNDSYITGLPGCSGPSIASIRIPCSSIIRIMRTVYLWGTAKGVWRSKSLAEAKLGNGFPATSACRFVLRFSKCQYKTCPGLRDFPGYPLRSIRWPSFSFSAQSWTAICSSVSTPFSWTTFASWIFSRLRKSTSIGTLLLPTVHHLHRLIPRLKNGALVFCG